MLSLIFSKIQLTNFAPALKFAWGWRGGGEGTQDQKYYSDCMYNQIQEKPKEALVKILPEKREILMGKYRL